MSGLIGKKIGMTSIYDNSGKNVPCTILQVGPCIITQIKTEEKDGYSSFQLGFDDKTKESNKATQGHFKKSKSSPKRKLVEFSGYEGEFKVGDKINVDHFLEGEYVDVTGTSKGKGYAGVIKRHNFKMQDATHGNSLAHRAHGSIGQCQTPGRVWKGKKMSGHMGNVQKTIQSLEIVELDKENNLIFVKGSIPGFNGSTVKIKPSIKKS